jgi:hypothetical protein
VSWEDVPPFRPTSLHALMRPSCSHCGHAPIVWMFAGQLPLNVATRYRPDAVRLLAQVSGQSDAWMCLRCDGFGVMLD